MSSQRYGKGKSSKMRKLCRFEQAPVYLQSNPYLYGGYRVHLSKLECIASIFSWTNETVNIWSHLLGFILFTGFLIHDVLFVIPALSLTWSEIFSVIVCELCIMCSLSSSAAYHTLNCHSEETFKKVLKWDVDGVSLAVLGCHMLSFTSVFCCFENWKVFYHTINVILAAIVLLLNWRVKHRSNEDHTRMTVALTSWIFLGMLPPFHSMYLSGGFQNPVACMYLVQVAVYYSLLGGGFFFYLSRYPEKCCPGKVDTIGASHQFWHILILSGFIWWRHRCIMNLEYKYINGCSLSITQSMK